MHTIACYKEGHVFSLIFHICSCTAIAIRIKIMDVDIWNVLFIALNHENETKQQARSVHAGTNKLYMYNFASCRKDRSLSNLGFLALVQR
jgi:hypothetical protein